MPESGAGTKAAPTGIDRIRLDIKPVAKKKQGAAGITTFAIAFAKLRWCSLDLDL